VLLDDLAARTAAEGCGLTVTGVLGVLKTASAESLLHLPEAIERRRRTNFRASPALLRSMQNDP
jgi:predicted nucleic acid-binding protein